VSTAPHTPICEAELDTDLGEFYYGEQKNFEEKLVDDIIEITSEYVTRRFREGRVPALRDAHAKDNGCVRATFCVDSYVDPELRHGVFKEQGRAFQAWIRFSSGNSEIRSSRWPDPHAMAIKLLGVDGDKLLPDEKKTQDFILIDSPNFFVDDLIRYKKAQQKYFRGGPFSGLKQWASIAELRGREIVVAAKGNTRLMTNPLYNQYWSSTPYRLGVPPGKRFAVKYTAKPCSPNPANALSRLQTFLAPDFSLKNEMSKVLSKTEVCFDFYIQRYVDDEHTPVEDSKVVWDESVSKPEHVARIVIPSPNVITPARDAFCENLSFNPWHSLPEHKPLGAVNRVRKKVYLKVSEHRHKLNGIPQREPAENEGV
jgi:hypothetical protein